MLCLLPLFDNLLLQIEITIDDYYQKKLLHLPVAAQNITI